MRAFAPSSAAAGENDATAVARLQHLAADDAPLLRNSAYPPYGFAV